MTEDPLVACRSELEQLQFAGSNLIDASRAHAQANADASDAQRDLLRICFGAISFADIVEVDEFGSPEFDAAVSKILSGLDGSPFLEDCLVRLAELVLADEAQTATQDARDEAQANVDSAERAVASCFREALFAEARR